MATNTKAISRRDGGTLALAAMLLGALDNEVMCSFGADDIVKDVDITTF